MRRLYFLCSVGVLSIGSLTGCSVFRGPETDANRRAPALPPSAAKGQPVQVYKAPVMAKSEDKAMVRIGTEAVTIPAPATPVVSAPVKPAVPALAPPPRLPNVGDLPTTSLPAPPTWKSSAVDGPVPMDKIVINSNLEPSAGKGTLHDLIDPAKPASAPVARTTEAVPVTPKEKVVAIESTPIQTGHDEKFTTITGQLQQYRKTFRLRYAPIDQEDIYGGVVTLEIGVDLSQLREGKHVRVRGVLIPPTERNEPARYRVTALEPLD